MLLDQPPGGPCEFNTRWPDGDFLPSCLLSFHNIDYCSSEKKEEGYGEIVFDNSPPFRIHPGECGVWATVIDESILSMP